MFKYVKDWIIFFIIPLALDRITKNIVIAASWYDWDYCSYLGFYSTINYGVSFGWGASYNPVYQYLLWSFIALVLIGFVSYMYALHKEGKTVLYQAALLVFSGAVSNFYDRLYWGGVIDFISVHYGWYYFPTFNVADISISIGIVFMLFVEWHTAYTSRVSE